MTTPQRVDPFAVVDEDLDLTGIETKPRRNPRPDKAETKTAAERMGFKSREPAAPALPAAPAPAEAEPWVPRSRRRAKSTKEQFNLRAERADIERLCQIADERKWLLGDAFGEAVAALAEKLAH